MRAPAFPLILCLAALGACRPAPTAPSVSQGAVYRKAWLPGMMGSESVREGRGALFDDQRVELVERPPSRWSLVFGRLGDSPSRVDVPALDGCKQLNLAYVAGSLMFACTPPGDPSQRARFFRSTPAGGAFSELPSLRITPRRSPEVFPLSPRGEVLITGACAPDAPCPSDSLERAAPQILVRDAGGKLERAKLADSELEQVRAVRVTPGGDIYGLAGANGILFVVVSRDHGRTFVRRELPSLIEGNRQDDPRITSDRAGTTLHAEDGGAVVVLAAANRGGWLRYVSRDHGAHFEVRRIPIEADAIDLAGRRGFAYAEAGAGLAWETNDAGATWHPVKPPARDSVAKMHFTDLVACREAGCLFDANVARLGWDLPSTAGEKLR